MPRKEGGSHDRNRPEPVQARLGGICLLPNTERRAYNHWRSFQLGSVRHTSRGFPLLHSSWQAECPPFREGRALFVLLRHADPPQLTSERDTAQPHKAHVRTTVARKCISIRLRSFETGITVLCRLPSVCAKTDRSAELFAHNSMLPRSGPERQEGPRIADRFCHARQEQVPCENLPLPHATSMTVQAQIRCR